MPDVTLDFTKAQPLAAPNASQGASAGVSLDFAKAQPIDQPTAAPTASSDDEQGSIGHAWDAIKRAGSKPYGQQLQDTALGATALGAGMVHSLGETLQFVNRINPANYLMSKIPWLRDRYAAAEQKFGAGVQLSKAVEGLNPAMGGVGEGVEQLAEFMGGDEIVKGMAEGLKLAPEVSRAGKVAYTAARNAIVGGVQAKAHGATGFEAAAAGAAAGVTGGVLESGAQAYQALRSTIINKFGLSGDLAAKIDAKVAQAEGIRQDTLRTQSEIHARAEAQRDVIAGEPEALPSETESAIRDRATDELRASEKATKDSMARTTALQADVPHAVNRITADAAQAVQQEEARVMKPFAEIGESITKPVSNAADVRAMLETNAERLGVDMTEIPRDATKALGNRGLIGNGGEFEESDLLSFNEVTRVRNDLFEAGQRAKDGTVRASLMTTYDELTKMQQEAAKAAGLGERYAAAKADFSKFKKELGSGMMQDFLSARNFAEQHYSGRLAQLTRGSDAEALRDLLKNAGIDASPLDRMLSDLDKEEAFQKKMARVPEIVGKRTAGAVAKNAAEQNRLMAESASERAARLQQIGKSEAEGIRNVGKQGAARAQEIGTKNPIVPGGNDLELAGKSNLEVKRARLQALGKNMQSAGIRAPFQMAMTVYGLFRMADGMVEGQPQKVATGGALALYGGARLKLPELVQSKAFQDWLLREGGVDLANKALVARLRTAIAGMAPQLQKRIAASQQQGDED